MSDPDGNQLLFAPAGHHQVDQIEFKVGVSDVALSESFYGDLLGAERIGRGRYRLGQTIISLSVDSARQVKTEPLGNPLDAVVAMAGVGFRYLTIQVRDCAAEYQRPVAKGVNLGVALTVGAGPQAGIFMVRDPDGNWIGILAAQLRNPCSATNDPDLESQRVPQQPGLRSAPPPTPHRPAPRDTLRSPGWSPVTDVYQAVIAGVC
jgi:catechol 2,3-dioxygenase-like lactoylglutathione lyase family enzyme